jgi:hypothetical protein
VGERIEKKKPGGSRTAVAFHCKESLGTWPHPGQIRCTADSTTSISTYNRAHSLVVLAVADWKNVGAAVLNHSPVVG